MQLDVVLVRPEPRNLRVGQGIAADCGRCGLRLLQCVVHRLEAQSTAQQTVRVIRAIAGGKDVIVGGLAVFVDHDSVVARQTGILGERSFRQDTDADNYEIGIDLSPIREHDLGDSAVTLESAETRLQKELDAVCPVNTLKEPGYGPRDNAVHDAICHLDHRYLQVMLRRYGGNLEANVAATDDDE